MYPSRIGESLSFFPAQRKLELLGEIPKSDLQLNNYNYNQCLWYVTNFIHTSACSIVIIHKNINSAYYMFSFFGSFLRLFVSCFVCESIHCLAEARHSVVIPWRAPWLKYLTSENSGKYGRGQAKFNRKILVPILVMWYMSIIYSIMYIYICYSIDCFLLCSTQLHIDLNISIYIYMIEQEGRFTYFKGFPSILVEFKNLSTRWIWFSTFVVGNIPEKKQLKTQHSLTQVGLKWCVVC